jgi:porphobilinogen synthase
MTRPHYAPIAAPFPSTRLRRNRRDAWSRELVAESRLDVADLIWPLFVLEGRDRREPVAAMPGVDRLTIDRLLPALEEASASPLSPCSR